MNRLIIKSPARVKCQIYSRVVGYLRPTSQWNDAKQSEFRDRKTFITKLQEKNNHGVF